MPPFKNLESALIDRFVPLEFKKKFRGTDKENSNLLKEILSNKEEIEAFIYDSLEAYKKIQNSTDFLLKLSEKETREIILKHETPLNYLISKVILKYDEEAYITETFGNEDNYIINNELNQILIKLAEIEGLDLTTVLNKNNKIDPKKLTKSIISEFELYDITLNEGHSKYTTVNERVNNKQKKDLS